MSKINDLTGQKIENWTVTGMDHKNAYGAIYWNCVCDCGYEKKIRTNSLNDKKYLWCPGCSKRPRKRYDITGQKFGRLTVIGKDKEDGHITFWKCKCECGNITSVRISYLRNGHTRSCGCLAIESGYVNIKNRYLNKYTIVDDTVYVTLTNGSIMLCDIDDWERLKIYTWRLDGNGYAFRSRMKGEKSSDIHFHACVIKREGDMVIDHINRNKLDNRKCNLRVCTSQVNTLNRGIARNNTSGCTGVNRVKNRWVVHIGINHKNIYLGSYKNFDEAVKVRKEAEKKYHKPLLEMY